MSEKQRYATIGTWIKVFRDEGYYVGTGTMVGRLERLGIVGITGRNSVGKIRTNAFFAESDVREAVADLLHDFPQVNKEGLVFHEDHTYGNLYAISRLLGINYNVIYKKLRSERVPSIQGRSRKNRVFVYYSVSEVEKLFQDYVGNIAEVNEEGFVVEDGELFGTLYAICKKLNVSRLTLLSGHRLYLKAKRYKHPSNNSVVHLYPLSEIKELIDKAKKQ